MSLQGKKTDKGKNIKWDLKITTNLFLLDFRESTFQNHFIRSLQLFCSGGGGWVPLRFGSPNPAPQIPGSVFEICFETENNGI